MDDTLQLIDNLGRPVNRSKLKGKPLATSTTTGVRSSSRSTAAADSISPARLATILQSCDRGDQQAFLELAELMEEREVQYRTVLTSRKLAVTGLELKVRPASADPVDEERAAEVLKVFQAANPHDVIEDMLDAIGKGFSAHEINWNTKTTPWVPTFEYVDPRWFQFSGEAKRDLRLRTEDNREDGIELPPWRFLTHFARGKSGHPIRAGLARLVAVSYMCKSYALKDWVAFAEVFGMPLRVGKYPDTLNKDDPQALEDLDALVDAVANLGTDAAAVIPENMSIEFVTTQRVGGGGDQVFKNLAEYIDKQISKAVLGQTMTTDDGSSLSQSATHNDVRHEYRNSDALRVMADVNSGFVVPYVALNYGEPENGYPVLYLDTTEPQDLVALTTAITPLIDRGMEVPEEWARSQFGIPDTEGEGALVLRPKGGGSKAAPSDPTDPEPEPEPEPDDEDDEEGEGEGGKKSNASRDPRVAFAAAKKTEAAALDVIDVIAAEALEQASDLTDPLFDPIRDLVQASKSYAEFELGLLSVLEKMDQTAFGDALAVAMLKARGQGDARDSVKP